jgi:hypothetical protein
MTLSLHDVTVGAFVPQIKALSGVFERALKFAEEKKIDPAAMLQSRLYPNMFTLSLQIRAMCYQALMGTSLMAGREQPAFPRGEDTPDALKKLMADTIDALNGIKPSEMEGAETRAIKLKTPGGTELSYKNGVELLTRFTAPNFYFHNTTAYNLLRQMGMEIGKAHFLGMG